MTLNNGSHFPSLFNEFFMAFVCSLRPFYHKRAFEYPYKLRDFRDNINNHQNEWGKHKTCLVVIVSFANNRWFWHLYPQFTHLQGPLCAEDVCYGRSRTYFPENDLHPMLDSLCFFWLFSFTYQRKFRFSFSKKGQCIAACFEHD